MGSLWLGGVRFVVYSNDHPPRHVHGFYAETEAIVDLCKTAASPLPIAKMRSGLRMQSPLM